MSDYKEVHGTAVLSYAGDVPNVLEGQVWYNSTVGDFRYGFNDVGSWSTGNNLNTAKYNTAGAGGSPATFLIAVPTTSL